MHFLPEGDLQEVEFLDIVASSYLIVACVFFSDGFFWDDFRNFWSK